MITILSSPKPGSGVSTTAALLALAVRHDTPTHLVDLCGDQSSLFGLVPHPGVAVNPADRLIIHDLTGTSLDEQAATIDRLAQLGEHVIIDAGTPDHPVHDRPPARTVRRWVLRPCYIALRRVATYTVRPDEVIMLAEPGRSLTTHDIAAITSAPVTVTIDIDPHIARATDAGLLCTRPPASVLTALAGITCPHQARGR